MTYIVFHDKGLPDWVRPTDLPAPDDGHEDTHPLSFVQAVVNSPHTRIRPRGNQS